MSVEAITDSPEDAARGSLEQPGSVAAWQDYQPARKREKIFYDIKLRDGEVVECCYPNGVGWFPMHPQKPSKHGRIPDYRVTQIRKCRHPMDMSGEKPLNDPAQRPGL